MTALSERVALAGAAGGGLARLRAPLLVAGFAALLLAGIGFAPAAAIHDIAHDARHGLAFPCH